MSINLHARYTTWFPGRAGDILVVVNDLQDPGALAATLAALHHEEPLARIHLLAARELPSPYARRHLRRVNVTRALHESAAASIASLGALLDAAGVPHRRHIQVGPWLETIAEFAADRGCRRILVGDNRASFMKNLLLRHDRARLQARMARAGFSCRVMCRGEPLAARAVSREEVA